MGELSQTDLIMFSKWHCEENIQHYAEFWDDVYDVYRDKEVTIPLQNSPQSIRRLQSMLNCESCSRCCYYEKINVSQHDIERISDKCDKSMHELVDLTKQSPNDGSLFIDTRNGCPLLDGKKCSVYEGRPDGCWMFPAVGTQRRIYNNQAVDVIVIKMSCRATLDVVRKIILESLQYGGVLLPDLTVTAGKAKGEAALNSHRMNLAERQEPWAEEKNSG